MAYPADALVRRDVLALRDAGFEVDLVCAREPGRPFVEHVDGITVWRIPPKRKRGGLGRYAFEYTAFPLLASLVIALRCLRGKFRWIEINNLPDSLMLAAVLPKFLGTKVAFYYREDMPGLFITDRDLSPTHPAVRLLQSIERMCARLADRIITPQELARRELIQRGTPPDKIVVIPNGPDERIVRARPQTLPFQGARDPGGHGPFRLVTHGTLVKRYGIETLLEAVSILRNRIPAIQLEVLGDGEYRSQLEAVADRLGLGSHVTFTGWLPSYDEVAARLARADLGVVSLWTDFQLCIKLMDYLALGLPVVTTESAALRPYLDETEVCYVRPKDPQALADAVMTLYLDPERRTTLATAGHAAYLEHFAWQRVKHDYLAVYASDPSRGSRENSQKVTRARNAPRHDYSLADVEATH